LRASVRHTDARHRQGAQGTNREHPQASSCQTAKDDGGKPGVRLLARSKRGTRFRTAPLLGGKKEIRRRFWTPLVGRDRGRRRRLSRRLSAQGWARHPSRSRRLLSVCSFARVPARDRIDDATHWASRIARFTSLAPLGRRTARGSSVHRTRPWPHRRSLRGWSPVFLKPQFRAQAESRAFRRQRTMFNDVWSALVDEPMSQLRRCATRLLNLLGPE